MVIASALAQDPPATAGPVSGATQEPSLTSQVDEVSLDIVVHDKRNKPILDLTPDKLTVTDNDKPVPLKTFRLVKGEGGAGHLITFVFEGFEGASAKVAQSVANKIIRMVPMKDCSFAVLDVRGRLRLIQAFTTDRSAIEHAVVIETASEAMRLQSSATTAVNILIDKSETARKNAATEAEKNLLSVARTGADLSGAHVDVKQKVQQQTILAALRDAHKVMQDQHAKANLAGLLAVLRSQQQLSGRKAIVYFTANRQLDSAAKEMVKTISAAATRAGISVYVVDMDALDTGTAHQLDNAMLNGGAPFVPGPQVVPGSSGMATTTPMQQASAFATSSGPLGTSADFMMRSESNPLINKKSPLSDLAVETGGAYIDAQENVKKPLEAMLGDLTTYYEATYVPTLQEYDGSFHTIAIKPQKGDLKVQAKTGYYAVAPGADAGIRPFEVPILKTLASTQLPADFPFHAAVLRHGDLPDGETSTLAVEVPLSQLQVKKDAHTSLFTAHAGIVAQLRDKNGVVVEHFAEDITKRGALESLDRDASSVISFQRHFISIPGKYTIEVAVADEYSGKTSAQRSEFEIPEAHAAPGLSDIVLVRRLDAARDEEDDPLEPLRYEKNKITPNLSGELPANAKGVSLFFILHPDEAVKDSPTLEMQVFRNGNPGRRTPLPLHWEAGQSALPYLASFGSSALSPGQYEIKAYLNHAGKTAVQSVSFSVEGAQPGGPANASASAAGKASGDAPITINSAEAEPAGPGQLAITALTNSVAALSDQEAHLLLADARQHALAYHDSLPNFMVLEVTNRSVDADGKGKWKLQDTIIELLRYRDKQESRTTLEVNGKPSATSHEGMKGALSEGEFGGILKAIFSESSKSEFQWKETAGLNDGTVQVFNYRVLKPNSMFGVVGTDGRELIVGFHGQVFIDSGTRSVRRATLIADDLPKDFSTHYSTMAVDYDYVAINEHDYLLPVGGEMRLVKGKHTGVLNTIEFRNYKRFGSNVRILNFKPVDDSGRPQQ